MGGCFSIQDRTAVAAKAGAEAQNAKSVFLLRLPCWGGMPQLSQHSWSNSLPTVCSQAWNRHNNNSNYNRNNNHSPRATYLARWEAGCEIRTWPAGGN